MRTHLSTLTLLTALLGLSINAIGLQGARAEESTNTSTTTEPSAKKVWELDGAFFKSLSGGDSKQIGTARLLLRRFLNESVSIGPDFRFWPAGSYPLSENSSSSAWAVGGHGQLYLFKNQHIGAYLAGSLLWMPNSSDLALAPEVGIKWFASRRIALGISYWILSDLGSYATSFEPHSFGKSRQNLGLEFSVYL